MEKPFKTKKYLLIFSIVALLLLPVASHGASYQQVAGLIDLRSTFSDGAYDIETLAQMAKDRGFEVIVINDHDRMAMEYGLPPFRNILRKRVDLPSINKNGAKAYLDSIKRVQEKYSDMVIIPGSETAAFYYWTGSYFKKNLTAHDHEKRILTIGMKNPEDYENLPILHNGFSTQYMRAAVFGVLPGLVFILASIFLVRKRGFCRACGVISLILGAAFIINSNPFRSSPFDQYHGDQGTAPYRLLTDYVNSRGGLTFWNYPETNSGVRKMGPIFVSTPPHPEVLEESEGYTGFAALYGDNITVTEPGNVWDRVLTAYCRGTRSRPVWGISTADFHEEGGAGEKLGNFPTVFFVREKSRKGVMEALKNGKMYAYRGGYPQFVRLDEFSVRSSDGKNKGISGDEISLKESPRIRISLSAAEVSERKVKVRLIRSGKLVKIFEGVLPMRIDYEDRYFQPGERIYYRMDMRGCGTLVSNPIFVRFEG
ncbi:MAG: hypothetical protein SRB1_02423 [Desulfobacteraceae bacterium Eth-SRB1]|nr:MAG: hypothetical protein SRB1_02423 [Desulfobacteraceae bacterium Eth-SRB1]